MLIACVADIHSPQFFDEFVRAVDSLRAKPDLFLIAGDMINRGRIEEFEKICNVLFGKIYCPMVACFGNNEYPQLREEMKKKFPEIKFLDDESLTIEIQGMKVGIVGSTGSLDKPTTWQRRNVPNIEEIYEERLLLVDKLLAELKSDFKILLIHYAPTYKTLEGEDTRFYANLGSKKYEKVLIERKPDLVVHAHAHNGTKRAWIDTVPIFNVAFPANKEIVLIDTEKDLKPGITKFV